MIDRIRKHWSRDVDAVIRSRHYTWLGMGLSGEPVEEALAAVLTDIMHICKREGLSWDELLERSRARFAEEEDALAQHHHRN